MRWWQILSYPIDFIEPSDNILTLEKEITALNAAKPFTLIIDLTRGKLSAILPVVDQTPQWCSLSIGRVREAAGITLPTSGHVVSHNVEEVQNQLSDVDTSHILVLDDTSFSGATSLLVEKIIRKSFPERSIHFTHGFLIVNSGKLGDRNGAQAKLSRLGSKVLKGCEMQTPRDDGWHFFDLVNQQQFEDHLEVVGEMLIMLCHPNFNQLVAAFLSNEEILRLMFPQMIVADQLRDLEKSGHFIATKKITDGFFARNPQLLPSIITQHHIIVPDNWKASQKEVLELLLCINRLLVKEEV